MKPKERGKGEKEREGEGRKEEKKERRKKEGISHGVCTYKYFKAFRVRGTKKNHFKFLENLLKFWICRLPTPAALKKCELRSTAICNGYFARQLIK